MKILLFIETLRAGGKERRLVELIKGLTKDKSMQLELVITKEDIHYEDIYATGIKIHFAVRKFFKKDPRVFFKIYKIVRKMKPDIIHVWGNVSAIYATPIKIITRTYMINNQITDAPSKVSNSLLSHRLTFPFSDKIVSNSKAGLKAYDAPKEKSLVIYNGFDFNRITNIQSKESIRSKFNINTKYVVGMVATFYEMKDYATYIKAANGILKNNKEITFLCIGAGDDISTKALVDPENIDNILFLGKQNNVESIMNVCDIGILATFTEGISNSLLEFMSLKKPIVITGGGGCAELIEHNANGYLLEQGDHLGLSERIVELIDDEKLAIRLGERSKKIVEEKFGIDKMIKGYKELYSSIKLT